MCEQHPYSSRYSVARFGIAAVLLVTLTACGYKGPLNMPNPPPPAPDASLTTPPTPSQPLSDTTAQ